MEQTPKSFEMTVTIMAPANMSPKMIGEHLLRAEIMLNAARDLQYHFTCREGIPETTEFTGELAGELKEEEKYDPMRDENQLYTLREFERQFKTAVADWCNSSEAQNELIKQPRTWSKWVNDFIRFMSW